MSTLTAPRKPEPHECCGTGCIPCVMDLYEEDLFEYEKALRQEALAAATAPATPTTSPTADPV